MFFEFSKIEDYPTLPQALEAKKEAEIVMYQSIEPFMTNSVKYVVNEIDLKIRDNFQNSKFFLLLSIFNYGYIMGKRAERQRKHKTT